MSTDRETTRLVRSWLEEGVTRLPDRVLDAVLDRVPATPQRRSGWSAWRSYRMNTYARLAAVAAVVVLVAVVGYRFLPGNDGVGGPGPSPTPTLLAKGTFFVVGYNTTLDATGTGTNVSGSLHASNDKEAFTVALQCERTIDGVRWIGGDVTESTSLENAPVGSRTAIILQQGSPAKAIFYFQMNDPASASCMAFFDDALKGGPLTDDALQPITGTVQLAP
jgi:hypothetical protein